MTRTSWDDIGLELASVIAKRAACSRSRVGAAIVTKDKSNVFLGFNGTASGEIHCTDGGCERGKFTYAELPPLGDYSTCSGLHAEHNALLRAGSLATGGTLYVTREPCAECYQLAKEASIERILWRV